MLAHPIKWIFQEGFELKNLFSQLGNGTYDPTGLEGTQPKQLIIIGQNEFEKMKASLDVAGLDDLMLKKMLLAYNTGKYSHNADIIIQLTEEEAKSGETTPFEVKQGKEIDQISMNFLEKVGEQIKNNIEEIGK